MRTSPATTTTGAHRQSKRVVCVPSVPPCARHAEPSQRTRTISWVYEKDVCCPHVCVHHSPHLTARFKADVALIKFLGINSYRFSIAWPRIIPNVRTYMHNHTQVCHSPTPASTMSTRPPPHP
jgi:hypothetical protein